MPLLLLLPLIELVLLIVMGQFLGFGLSLLWLLTSAVIGYQLLQRQKRAGLRLNARAGLAAVLGQAMPERLLLSMAAVLLIIPGFLSDFLALLLLLPPVRRWLLNKVLARLGPLAAMQGFASARAEPARPAGQGQLLEGEFERKKEE